MVSPVAGLRPMRAARLTRIKKLPNLMNTQITFHPDGTGSCLYTEAVDLSSLLTWDTPGQRGLLPGWSPDGRYLAFGGFDDSKLGLWCLDVRSSNAVQLAEGPFTLPAWSPDGKRLSFDYRGQVWETRVALRNLPCGENRRESQACTQAHSWQHRSVKQPLSSKFMLNRIMRYHVKLALVSLVTLSSLPPVRGAEGLPGEPIHATSSVLEAGSFKSYVDTFNADDNELYQQKYPNAAAWDFLKENIPLFECPDKELEKTYYFRWWTYRKHIRETPDGYVVTEFLPDVPWAGKYNTIPCPAGHHFYEGRWLKETKILDDYALFWFRKGGDPRKYSFWAADAIWARCLVTGNPSAAKDLLPDLVKNFEAWEKKRRDNGYFWQYDNDDGMEVAVGGNGYRPTINSYMYGDAKALAKIAGLVGDNDTAARFEKEAAGIKEFVQTKLWDKNAQFFKLIRRGNKPVPAEEMKLADVREEIGFTPWYFNLPNPGFEVAWKQLLDVKGFKAPYGPTVTEQRHPGFAVRYEGHECQWNGPSWPLSTAITLTSLANLLNNYQQTIITKADYFEALQIYSNSHRRKREDGKIIPWIDENLNPFTGDWLSRTLLMQRRAKPAERGKDYNHSTFCDLVITGLAGLRPRADNIVEVNPLLPAERWDYFCLDRVNYHGKTLTIIWDKTGGKYGRGKGLRVFANGKEIAVGRELARVTGELP